MYLYVYAYVYLHVDVPVDAQNLLEQYVTRAFGGCKICKSDDFVFLSYAKKHQHNAAIFRTKQTPMYEIGLPKESTGDTYTTDDVCQGPSGTTIFS